MASLSGFNARDCVFQHDDCRNTHTFKHAGQNIGIQEQSDQYLDTTAALQKTINDWFDENSKCPPSAIDSYQAGTGAYGHFTQMVQDKSDRVGCAVVRYLKGGWYNTYIVCDYAVTNILNQPVYVRGQQCSQCTGNCGANYPGLCVSMSGGGGNTNTPPVNQPADTQPAPDNSQPSVDSGIAPVMDPGVAPVSDPGVTSVSDPGVAPVSDPGTQVVGPTTASNDQQILQNDQPDANSNGWLVPFNNDPSIY